VSSSDEAGHSGASGSVVCRVVLVSEAAAHVHLTPDTMPSRGLLNFFLRNLDVC
jgi:hypothetical protein